MNCYDDAHEGRVHCIAYPDNAGISHERHDL
jgi:hypothetical protein